MFTNVYRNLKDKLLNNRTGDFMKQISLSIGSDHRGMKLKDQLSNWLIPIDSDIGTRFNIDLFHDIGPYDDKKKKHQDCYYMKWVLIMV